MKNLILVLALFAVSLTFAQQPPVSSHLLLPVVVTDRNGAAIKGLHAEDFWVKASHAEKPPIGVREEEAFRLAPDASGVRNRPVFLVLDKLPLRSPDLRTYEVFVLKALVKLLQAGQPTWLLTTDDEGLKPVHSGTTSTSILEAALQQLDRETHILGGSFKAAPGPPSDVQQVDAELARLRGFLNSPRAISGLNAAGVQVRAMVQLAEWLGKLPGRKAVMWVSPGFYLEHRGSDPIMSYEGTTDDYSLTLQYESMVEQFAAAEVSLYPGVIRDAGQIGSPRGDPFQELATATGGKMFWANISQDLPVHEMLQDCQSYYLLSQDLPPDRKHIRWERVNVSIKNKDARVRAPEGLFIVPTKK